MPLPRCTIVPLPNQEVSLRIAGRERLRWHASPSAPRPFFYPLRGPASGESLTRMGHPGDPGHDHHRSIWFAHQNVSGIDFWNDRPGSTPRIRQLQWYAYHDGEDEAALAVQLGWFDGHDPRELLTQELIVSIAPGPRGETFVELQSTFTPTAATLEFGKTNFGFLAVRVAKALSVRWGGGILSNSDNLVGEPALFAKPARWVDYSGTIVGPQREGITYFDHPMNPGSPNSWHVRADGWMGCGACLREPILLRKEKPLVLRYLLHAHRDEVNGERANRVADAFGQRPAWRRIAKPAPNETWGLRRAANPA